MIVLEHARDQEEAYQGRSRVGGRKGRIELAGFAKKRFCLNQVSTVKLQEVPHPALIQLPGAQMLGGHAAGALAFGRADLRLERTADGVGDLVLKREHVLDGPVVSLGPDLSGLLGLD